MTFWLLFVVLGSFRAWVEVDAHSLMLMNPRHMVVGLDVPCGTKVASIQIKTVQFMGFM